MALYRCMTPDADGLPRVGDSARCLGVRAVDDIAPDSEGRVHPRTGGMSVAPNSLWNLPHHRRPRRLGRGSTGRDSDRVFAIDGGAVEPPLTVRMGPDAPDLHALVEPDSVMLLGEYRTCLARTRPSWRLAER